MRALHKHMHATLARSLRDRTLVDDADFDRLFPPSQRFRSWLHWTPVDVAMRVGELAAPGNERVLDVGSGVGKACLIGAATTGGAWFGIEQDLEMVRAANAAARRLELEHRVRFIRGDMTALDWSSFDSFYLFNPFAESLFSQSDDALAQRDRYVEHIYFVQQQLALVRVGTRVVTYHGFGGDMPEALECVHSERARDGELCLWIRR
jgi:SAM-dependent methyltransferase